MKTTKLKFCFVVVLSIVLAGCSNNQPAPGIDTAAPKNEASNAALPVGRQLFTDKCAACHGEDGTAGIAGAANLRTLKADSLTIIETIKQGKKAMPAFGNTLSETEVEQVAKYITTLNTQLK